MSAAPSFPNRGFDRFTECSTWSLSSLLRSHSLRSNASEAIALEMSWRHLLLTATLGYHIQQTSAYVVNDPLPTITGHDTIPAAWVSIQPDGAAETIIPGVHTTETGVATKSAPPPYLTQTAIWTLTAGSISTTSTGLSPVATAIGPGEAGSFLSCDNYQRYNAPFCQPKDGSTLASGRVYYGTSACKCFWDRLGAH